MTTAAKAIDVSTKAEYIVVPKSEWDMLNKDLENMQEIMRIQSRELNAFKSKEYQQFELLQEEIILGKFMAWMREHKLTSEFAIKDIRARSDFKHFLNHIRYGCERARQEYVNRLVSSPSHKIVQ
jgi:hypothetical protein